MKVPVSVIALPFMMFALSAPCPAQVIVRGNQPDAQVDAQAVGKVVEAIGKALRDEYVFPDVAKKMSQDLRQRLDSKEYEKVTGSKELAKLLTEQLQAISKDKHIRVNYVAKAPMGMAGGRRGQPTPEEEASLRERMRTRAATENFGFQKVERLDGNVGYIDLRGFMPAEVAGDTAAAAMNFVANTDALIIDVRKNGGGAPSMVAMLCSYLFGPEPTHLNDLYFRPENTTHQWWTLPYVPGKRFERKPVYVLTSKRTFSAAEEFTYNLKTQKRATIVGETTGGGANPGGMRVLTNHFIMFVPSGRAINPITKTNWEGTGVTPDVPTTAELALKTAHLKALKFIAGEGADASTSSKKAIDPDRLRDIKKDIERLEKELGGTTVTGG
jgi:retinol-binding protein 3